MGFNEKLVSLAETIGGAVKADRDRITAVEAELSGAAADSNVVHKTGAEEIAGQKTFTSEIVGSVSGSASKLKTAFDITVKDADESHSGSVVSVDGSAAVTLKLPSTIKADVTGDLTGTASKATGDKDGADITATYLKSASTISNTAIDDLFTE